MFENLPFSSILVWLVISFYIIVVLLIISKLSSYIAYRQAQRWLTQNKVLIHEYSVSPDLTPVEFGYLFDRKFRDNELLALLVLMHQKKIIKLEKHNDKITIEQTPHRHILINLTMIELEVLSFIKSHGGSALWSDFSNDLRAGNDLHERYERFVHHSLEAKGYFEHGTLVRYRNMLEQYQKWVGAMLSIAFVMIPVYQSFSYSRQALDPGFELVDQAAMFLVMLVIAVCFWPAWYLYVGLVAKIFYFSSGIPYGATNKLRDKWRVLYGYKVFLHVVEKNRLRTDPNPDDKTMPWVIAVEEGPSAKQLEFPKK